MALTTAYARRQAHRIAWPMWRAVEVKRNWNDSWTGIPYLDCVSAVEVAAPSVGVARLRYDYGWIKRESKPFFSGFYPVDISGCYCRVGIAYGSFAEVVYPLWIGVVDYELHTPHGTTDWMQGPQEFNAYSLAHLLDRTYINGTYTENGFIDRPVRFNVRDGRGLVRKGNRTSSIGADGTFLFGNAGDEWSNYDILEYLIQYYGPRGLTFRLAGATEPLRYIYEQWDFNGLSVFQAMNQLINPKRGLGWILRTFGSGAIYIDVFSHHSEPVSVGDYTVPANQQQTVVGFDGRIDGQPEIEINSLARYDSLLVLGGPIYTTFSVSKADDTLEPGWTEEQETAYATGSEAEDAGAAEHDAERSTDKLSPVYREFRIPSTWQWLAGDGEGGTKYNAAPGVRNDGTIDETILSPTWDAGHVIERELCLQADTDAADPEHIPAFVVVQNPDDDSWHYVDKLSAIELTPSSVRVGDRGLSIRVEPQRVGHIAALGHFDTTAEGTGDSAAEPEYDYETYIATIQVATDVHLKVVGTIPGVPIRETGRTKVIEYPGAVAWLVLPGTVLDVQDGDLVKAEDWQVERNDIESLRAIASLAAAWYLQPRSNMRWAYQGVSGSHPVGQLVRGYSSNWTMTAVGTVVTKREWDFSGKVPITRWATGYIELEAKEAAGDKSATRNAAKATKGKSS